MLIFFLDSIGLLFQVVGLFFSALLIGMFDMFSVQIIRPEVAGVN